MLSMFLFVINAILSLLFLLYLNRSRRSKTTRIKYLRNFLNLKPIIYFGCIFSFAFFLSHYKIKALALLIPIYIIFLTLLDATIFYKLAMQLREGMISFSEYIKSSFTDMVIIILPLVLIVTLKILFPVLFKSPMFVLIMVAISYNILLPYILKLRFKNCRPLEINLPEEFKTEKYKVYVYDGEISKEANAMACGVIPPYHIYISDYLVDNLDSDELISVLLHEFGHIKKHHFVVKNLYLAGLYPLMSFLGWIMDTYFYSISIFLGIAIMLGVLILFGAGIFLLISRYQEYSADKFAISLIKDKNIFISALNKIKDLNLSSETKNKGEEFFSTHPPFDKRIKNIENTRF